MIASLDALLGYLPLLLVTLVVELAVVFWLVPRPQRRLGLETCLFLNLLTHPLGLLGTLQVPHAWLFVEASIFGASLTRVVGTVERGFVRFAFPRRVEGEKKKLMLFEGSG